MIDTIKELATDSNKSRSKKDRREQRHIFRDILRGVEEGDPPAEKVKFGQEVLHLEFWYNKIQYDWFSKVRIISIMSTLMINHVADSWIRNKPSPQHKLHAARGV